MSRKRILNYSRLVGVDLFFQLIILSLIVYALAQYFQIIYVVSVLLNMFIVIWLVRNNQESEYKIAWLAFIALVPFYGGLFYISFSGNPLRPKEKIRMEEMNERTQSLLKQENDLNSDILPLDNKSKQFIHYIENSGLYPAYEEESVLYYETGERYFEALIIALKSAKKYIFMEYYIINEGEMWDAILEILVQKVNEGVEVRLVYDDVGSSMNLPNGYHKKLTQKGIKCKRFNPLIPMISARYNTRNHRKITVVDGIIGFTGGVNIADEYINKKERFGHWKDMGIAVKGNAVWSFTVMFLTMWDFISKTRTDAEVYRKQTKDNQEEYNEGVLIPYSDNPLDNESVGENVYLNMINKAERYINITTPYLIISSTMLRALCNASKNGVKVKIITPHTPDKKFVHYVSTSYYRILLESGVEIYEYKPGFMHGKNFVVDDKYAVVGTINMDFRSLHLHFECGVFMINTKCIHAIKEDFDNTLTKCIEITMKDIENMNRFKLMSGQVLRVFSPLM